MTSKDKWTELCILINVGHKGRMKRKNGVEVLSLGNWKANGTLNGNGQAEKKKKKVLIWK